MSITGSFELLQRDNYGDFLKAIGVSMIQRTVQEKAQTIIKISKTEDKYTIRTESPLSTEEVTFLLGEDFDRTIAGMKSLSSMTLSGDALIENAHIDGGLATITWTPDENHLTISNTAKG